MSLASKRLAAAAHRSALASLSLASSTAAHSHSPRRPLASRARTFAAPAVASASGDAMQTDQAGAPPNGEAQKKASSEWRPKLFLASIFSLSAL